MWFLYDSVVAIQVALVCSAFAWLYGGTVAGALTPTMPWLLAMLFEFMICFPQRRAGETTYEARARTWDAMRRDPLTWVTIAFAALLMIPFFNRALCPVCDYPLIVFDGMSAKPPIPYLPSCMNRMHHFNVVIWFIPALTAMLAVKHSLLKRGKRLALELIVWNGFALSLVGIVQTVTGATGPLWQEMTSGRAYFFSTFGYPNMAGDYFTTLFALAVALWRWKVEVARRKREAKIHESQTKARHRVFWSVHLLLLPAVFFFVSALMTLSRASIILVSSLAILFYVHALTSFVSRMTRAGRVKALCANMFSLVAIVTLFLVFMSDDFQRQILRAKSADITDSDRSERTFADDLKREVGSVTLTGTLDRASGWGQYHARLATAIWKEHPLFGCGGWGYRHLSVAKMTDAEYKNIQSVGGANVHNDFLQFMTEHGIVGLSLIVAMIVLLVWPLGRIWKAIMDSVRFLKPQDQPPKPIAIFSLPAPVFCILLAAVATVMHSFVDCPLRSPAVLSLFFVSLAAMDGFLPTIREK